MGPLVPGCRVGPRSGDRSGVRPWALLVVGSAASLRPTSQSPGRQRQGTGALAGRVLAAQAAGVQPLEILQHGRAPPRAGGMPQRKERDPRVDQLPSGEELLDLLEGAVRAGELARAADLLQSGVTGAACPAELGDEQVTAGGQPGAVVGHELPRVLRITD